MAPVVADYESADDLRAEVVRLREENAQLRAQVEKLTAQAATGPRGGNPRR